MNINGICHCGEIEYEAEINPEHVIICHCTDCQNISGAPLRANVPVLVEKFQLQGNPQLYEKTAESGNKLDLAFCGNCGTALYSVRKENPEFYMLRLGAILQRDQLSPKHQGFCSSALP